jgi:4-hydroxy-2-oxoheptanedioate aldolase
MRKNAVKEKLRKGEPSIGTWLAIGHPLAAEVMAHQGFDWLTVDMEHNPIGWDSLLNMLTAISTTNVVPFVRTPWNDPQLIKRILDAGAYGVVIPNVKSREEAKAAVAACRYPPVGIRGLGGTRARLYGGDDYFEKANEEISVHVMIEDREAVGRAEEIMSVPGIDAVFIGPNDLACSMGVPLGLDNKHPDHVKAVNHVLAVGKKLKVPVGIHCGSAAEVVRRVKDGWQWLAVVSETRFMVAAAQQALKEIKAGIGK